VDYVNTFLKLKAEEVILAGFEAPKTKSDIFSPLGRVRESNWIRHQSSTTLQNEVWQNYLNYMWGKLTERNNRTHTKLISDPKVLYRFLAMPGIEVINLVFANDEVVWVSWKFTAEEN